MSSRGGGFCCVQNIATDDEGEDLASAVTATAAVRSQASSTKMARFHELKRQASASTSSQTSSPELRKREASPPLCTVTLRGRTVVKKSSPDSKVTVYVEKREFCDLGTCTEPVEGVVVLDRSQLQPSERLYVALVGRFRYGREEDEILGMSLCREIYLGHTQLCPDALEVPGDAPGPSRSPGRPLYSMQLGNVHRRLLEALGDSAVPFRFEFPRDAPVSTVMQRLTPGSGDTCGVRYLIRCYTVLEEEDRPPARSCVNMPIRKAQFACTPRSLPSSPRASSVCKDFPLNAGKLVVDASLPKELYLHGEEIVVKVVIQNLSQKTVKHVKASVLQVADICMFSTGRWKVCVATANNSKDDSPIAPGTTVEREISILPSLDDNQHKYGVFVQSYRGDDVDCLASSTIISDHAKKNLFGIVVSYEVKVKIGLGTLSSLSGRGEIACFVPFLLMHAGPAEVPKPDSFEENEILTVHRPMTPPPSTSGLPLTNGLEAAIAESANAGTAIVGPYESSPPASIDFLDESPTEGSPVALSQDLPEPEVIQKLSDINIRGVPPLID